MDLEAGKVCFGEFDPGHVVVVVDIEVIVKAWSVGVTQNAVGLFVQANFVINNTYKHANTK